MIQNSAAIECVNVAILTLSISILRPNVVHFNPKTKRSWGCFFSYNCDCEEFREAKSKV